MQEASEAVVCVDDIYLRVRYRILGENVPATRYEPPEYEFVDIFSVETQDGSKLSEIEGYSDYGDLCDKLADMISKGEIYD